MSNDPLLPRKLPRQVRAAATVEAILEAATRVLSDRSLAGFNTNRVAEVAGVSVGSLYQYFPNKAALVAALIERAQTSLAQAIEVSVERMRGRPLVEVLSGLIDIAVEHQFGNAVFSAALDHEEQRLPLGELLSVAQMRIVTAVQAAFESHPELANASLPACAAADCLAIAKALIEAEAAHSQPHKEPHTHDLHQRVLRALRGYLQPPT